jgi:bifunctional oligoribonuclease and PAP phosphatase NrnA
MSLFELEAALRFIRENDRFLVVSHVSPDGDAVGSTLAVGLMLGILGKTFTMANADPLPRKFAYLSGYDEVRLPDDRSAEEANYECVIAVDCADYERIGAAARWFSPDKRILNIDHHPTNDGYGEVRLIRPDAASTTELLHELIDAIGIAWSKPLAECIYTGLLTDTGGFRYSNTSPRVMQIASRMLSFGVSGYQLAEWLLEIMPYSQMQLLRRALATLAFAADRQICWMTLTMGDLAEAEANQEDSGGLVNYARNIEGVRVGLLFKESAPDEIKVSFRSDGSVDVADFAHSLGGGGHVRAAGCTLRMPMEEAVGHIVERLKGYLT